MVINVKAPKEAKGKNVNVELFANHGRCCPVRAYKMWLKWRGGRPLNQKPFFMRRNGSLATQEDVSKLLKDVFPELTDGKSKQFLSVHSFRSGLPSEMAKQGYDDEQIRRQGRWASEAFRSYIKLGRAERWTSQFDLARAMKC